MRCVYKERTNTEKKNWYSGNKTLCLKKIKFPSDSQVDVPGFFFCYSKFLFLLPFAIYSSKERQFLISKSKNKNTKSMNLPFRKFVYKNSCLLTQNEV